MIKASTPKIRPTNPKPVNKIKIPNNGYKKVSPGNMKDRGMNGPISTQPVGPMRPRNSGSPAYSPGGAGTGTFSGLSGKNNLPKTKKKSGRLGGM